MSDVQSSASDVDVDLGRLFGSLAARWKRILLVALLVTAAALVLTWYATPHYRGETRLLIESRESVFTRPQGGADDERPMLDEEGVTSQVQVITSTDLLKQVALKLNLAEIPEFDEAADMSFLSQLLVVVGLKNDPRQIPPEERVLKAFREKLNVYRVEKSRVIVIEMSSEDPKLAAEIPNALADAYLEVQSAAKLESNSEATNWLEPEIATLSQRVREAEARVATFRAQSDLLIGQNNSSLATQQLSELSSELSRTRANRAAAEANAASVRAVLDSGASLDALPEVLSSPLIQRLRERQVQLQADIADLSTTMLDNHPRLRSLRSQLSDLDRQIRTEAQNVLKALGAEANAAKLREQQLMGDLNTLKAASARAGEEEVELRALEREANAQRELLESYLARYREVSSRKDGNYLPADARIFSRAIVPSEPYFPKPLPIAGVAFAGSLLIMAIVTLLQELFSGRAMRPAPGSRIESAATSASLEPVAGQQAESPPVQATSDVDRGLTVPPTSEDVVATPAADLDSNVTEIESVVAPVPEVVDEVAVERSPDEDKPTLSEPAYTETSREASPSLAPLKREPLPTVHLSHPTFAEAWARHKRIMDAARYDAPSESPTHVTLNEPVTIESDPEMRNLFSRLKKASKPEETAPTLPSQLEVGRVSVEDAAGLLVNGGATRAIFVSPEGDEGAAAAVMVAREVADSGLRVLLLDLTASGAASRPMLDGASLAGITDLLVSEAQFTDTVHADHYSDCYVMPVGTVDPMRAMKAAERLPAIMEALTTAYDVVVVECGASDAEGIRRLVADGTEVMVSAIEPDEAAIAAATDLQAQGYGRVMMVSLAA
ncbi:exopolysaccharide transport family protein [Mesorhizobium sp. VNQ89]|uniref:exopolysaccharide transport family protein n=1 Tax=Mesorhizobium quangtriensis TaxID=3157709 RepID=UPI0032B7F2BA